MIYWIQIIYQFILPPGCIIIFLMAYVVYGQKHYHKRHIFLCGLVLLFYLVSTRIGADLLAKPLESTYYPSEQIDGDVLLMLGSGVMQHIPEIDGPGQPSPSMAKSMLMTAQLYSKTKLPILVSGGGVHDVSISEAEIALRAFRNLNIPDTKLYGETKSRNTAENAKNSVAICREHGWNHPILLVAALHAPRAAMFFKRGGIDVMVYPTYYRRSMENGDSLISYIIPSSGNLDDSAMAIKEYMGILAIKLNLQ